jgi:predicted ABC-type ATPase
MGMEIQITLRERDVAARVQIFSMTAVDARQFNRQVEMLKQVLTICDRWELFQEKAIAAHAPAKPKAVANG